MKSGEAAVGLRFIGGGDVSKPASGEETRLVEARILLCENKGGGLRLIPPGLLADDFGNNFSHFYEVFACAHLILFGSDLI